VFTLGFISFLRLIWSYKAIDAVTSFFGVLISLVYFFFFIRADYVGSIILMVYLGAIIIFFCFIIFTINPEKFAPASSIYKRGFNFSFFFFFILYFYVYYTSLSVILSDFFINFIPNDYTDVYDIWSFSNSDTSYVHVLGSILYTYYFIPVNMLGIMLFISLVGSLRMLNPINKKKVIVYINSKNI
jgi:NADH:ubiquinone oxidoreductase subunit 6 (subunit J)